MLVASNIYSTIPRVGLLLRVMLRKEGGQVSLSHRVFGERVGTVLRLATQPGWTQARGWLTAADGTIMTTTSLSTGRRDR